MRWIRKNVVIRSRLLDNVTGRAICAPVGSLGRRQTECQPGPTRLSARRQSATQLAVSPPPIRGPICGWLIKFRSIALDPQPLLVAPRSRLRQPCRWLSVIEPILMSGPDIARRHTARPSQLEAND